MNWGVHEYTVIQRILEIEKCLEQQMWQSALALSLTIPDICGLVEFPYNNETGGKSTVGYRYKKWFGKHVEHYFADHQGLDSNGIAINAYFTSVMCYALRNAFLHSGSDDIDQKYEFVLRVNSSDSYGLNEEGSIISVTIDISKLCKCICYAAEQFYNDWENKEDFNDKKCNWLDLNEWSYYFHSMNGEEQ